MKVFVFILSAVVLSMDRSTPQSIFVDGEELLDPQGNKLSENVLRFLTTATLGRNRKYFQNRVVK
jgi:hypothetical protein